MGYYSSYTTARAAQDIGASCFSFPVGIVVIQTLFLGKGANGGQEKKEEHNRRPDGGPTNKHYVGVLECLVSMFL